MRINEALSSLLSAFLDWDGVLINNRFIRDRNEITWEKRQNMDSDYPLTTAHVLKLIENNQYSMQVREDGSVFQIYYRYDRSGRTLCGASLSFFFLGAHIEQITVDDIVYTEYAPNSEIGWFRIDYDYEPGHDGGVIHAKCHMHLSMFPDTRIVVDRIPNPKQFIEFIIATCYPGVYKSKRLNRAGRFNDLGHVCNLNSPLLPDINVDGLYDFVAHLRIPNRITVENPLPQRQKKGGRR